MEYSCSELCEVEKIINCKYFKNKKYYLIKWLYYPINQSTWEPKSNLKNLKYLIDEFESQYPYTIDKEMYNIFCNEIKIQNKMKIKDMQLNPNYHIKFLSKKRKMVLFSDEDLNDPYFDGLKIHLHIKINENCFKLKKNDKNNLIIDLSNNSLEKDKESFNYDEVEKKDNFFLKEKEIKEELIRPNII